MTFDKGAPNPPNSPKPPKRPASPAVNPQLKERTKPLQENGKPSAVRYHPIAPPDTPMQFRAIGILEGHYVPSEEQFTKGTLVTPDGEEINAVLLGRIMSLVRKYIQTDRDYLWVVYPRTGIKAKQDRLHVQISGVWAPEEMGPIGEDPSHPKPQPEQSTEVAALPPKPPSADVKPDIFSIRGEVVRQKPEENSVTVKIVQSARKNSPKPKSTSFKLTLMGTLPTYALGEFWDFEVKRQGSLLDIVRAVSIGPAPKPKPRKVRKGAADKPRPRPQNRDRSADGVDKPRRYGPPKPRPSSKS